MPDNAGRANAAVVSRYFEEVINQGNGALIDDLLQEDYEFHAPPSQPLHGRQMHRQYLVQLRSAYENLQYRIEETVSEGNLVAVYWTRAGTQRIRWMGNPPSGRKEENSGQSLFRLENGKIARQLVHWDALSYHRRRGLVGELEHRDLTQKYYDIVNRREFSHLSEVLASDFQFHATALPHLSGAIQMRRMLENLVLAFPDIQWHVDEMVSGGDTVVTRWHCIGTHRHEWNGIRATGRCISGPGVTFHRIRDGKIVEERVQFDALRMFQQLGVALELPTYSEMGH